MAFAKRQHLGALQKTPHALGVFLWFISLPFHSRPRHAAGERADPLLRHPDADMGEGSGPCKTGP